MYDRELIGVNVDVLSGEIVLDFKVGDGMLIVAKGVRVEEEYMLYFEADSVCEHLIEVVLGNTFLGSLSSV